jgi:ketosteroid isomerase-like protein
MLARRIERGAIDVLCPFHFLGAGVSAQKELGQKVRPEGFKLLQITAQDERVVVEGQNRGTVHKTGRKYEHDWVMIFSVRNGKITRLRHYYDTGDLVGSFRGE